MENAYFRFMNLRVCYSEDQQRPVFLVGAW